ncbi:MAG TPA: YraN family protein [Candidatus Acidoferrum sp.]|nr:YraN family protein [Candidatus Acidoferrum sp.]
MPIVARAVFGIVNWAARKGLAEESGAGAGGAGGREAAIAARAKHAARRTGIRGETFAYWYLRRRGYTIIARNFMVPGMKGEIDLAGYDGKVLAFVEVKTRTMAADEKSGARPEDAVTPEKRRHLVRIARMFLAEWRIKEVTCRFDVLAIESRAGAAPVVRLHKDAFGSSAAD